ADTLGTCRAFVVPGWTGPRRVRRAEGRLSGDPSRNAQVPVLGDDRLAENVGVGSRIAHETDAVDERRALGQGDTHLHGSARLRRPRSQGLPGAQGLDKVDLSIWTPREWAFCAGPPSRP